MATGERHRLLLLLPEATELQEHMTGRLTLTFTGIWPCLPPFLDFTPEDGILT